VTPPSPGGVVAVVVADLPEPDVWAPLLGVPMAARTVDGLLRSGVVGQVVLLVRPDVAERARLVCAGLPVVVHCGPQRDAAAVVGGADCVLLHDGTRPLTPPALVADVARAAAGQRVVVPVVALSDTVKQVDEHDLVVGSPDRSRLCVVQTPQAFPPDLVEAVLAGDVVPEQAWTRVGEPAVTVPGHVLAFPVHSSWDRQLAELLAAGADR
jgi:2-C-methyl-D-erythritol 4-phosphate cytidylyltransferase